MGFPTTRLILAIAPFLLAIACNGNAMAQQLPKGRTEASIEAVRILEGKTRQSRLGEGHENARWPTDRRFHTHTAHDSNHNEGAVDRASGQRRSEVCIDQTPGREIPGLRRHNSGARRDEYPRAHERSRCRPRAQAPGCLGEAERRVAPGSGPG